MSEAVQEKSSIRSDMPEHWVPPSFEDVFHRVSEDAERPEQQFTTIVPRSEHPKNTRLVNLKDMDDDECLKTLAVYNELCKHLEETGGLGLHAAQLGYDIDVFAINFEKLANGFMLSITGPKHEGMLGFVNCLYRPMRGDKNKKKSVKSYEDCLTLPGETWRVWRYPHVKVTGYYIMSEGYFKHFNHGVTKEQGIVFQHEIDHGRGLLIDKHRASVKVDRVTEGIVNVAS